MADYQKGTRTSVSIYLNLISGIWWRMFNMGEESKVHPCGIQNTSGQDKEEKTLDKVENIYVHIKYIYLYVKWLLGPLPPHELCLWTDVGFVLEFACYWVRSLPFLLLCLLGHSSGTQVRRRSSVFFLSVFGLKDISGWWEMSCQVWRGVEGVLQGGSLQDVAPSFLKLVFTANFRHITFLCDCDQDSYFRYRTSQIHKIMHFWCILFRRLDFLQTTQSNAHFGFRCTK